jgi:hypothetical protein
MKLCIAFLSVIISAFNVSGNVSTHHKHSHKKSIRISEKLPSCVIRKSLMVNSKSEPRNDLIKLLFEKLEAPEGIGIGSW